MGQYHYLCNLSKREFVHPHGLGDGLKLWEMAGWSIGGVASAAVMLLAAPEPRGGGDFEPSTAYGRWHGDRIAVVGDYAEDSDLPKGFHASTIQDRCHKGSWTDITPLVREAMAQEFGLEYTGDAGSWLDRKEKGGPTTGQVLAPDMIVTIIREGDDDAE